MFGPARFRDSFLCSTVHRSRFASFLSGGFITAILVYPPEKKLEKRTSVQWSEIENTIWKRN